MRILNLGGYRGSSANHPQRKLSAALRTSGHEVLDAELPNCQKPRPGPCVADLLRRVNSRADPVDCLIGHSLAGRVIFLAALQAVAMRQPLEKLVLLLPANGRNVSTKFPDLRDFYPQDQQGAWTSDLSVFSRQTPVIITSPDDPYYPERDVRQDRTTLTKAQWVPLNTPVGHLNEKTDTVLVATALTAIAKIVSA